ncbi:MAG: D-aminoacyl-tRNA deacylase [Ignisphaera sp.]
MITIVISYYVLDPAGRGIANKIAELIKCEHIVGISNLGLEGLRDALICKDRKILMLGFKLDVIELDVLEKLSDITKYIVVISRHSAKSGRPSLTTHTPGNPWGRNDAGGKPWEIPPSNPNLMWYTLKELQRFSVEYALKDYEVCYEVTHHGPTSVTKPITFVELGSSENEWNNSVAHDVVALALLSAIDRTENEKPNCITSVGFGGTHYAPLFTRRAFEENECYGHIVPNYVIKELSLDELRSVAGKAMDLTPGCRRVVVEKMRKEVRNVIEDEASKRGLEVIRY